MTYGTFAQAVAAALNIRSTAPTGLLTRIIPCAYGGFVIRQADAEAYADALIDGLPTLLDR